ncbi:MAG: helix-turn-helix domain-containing protein [Clostridiales bacterium]|nr:helix-turn-helix domain-containing protein [Clostridiales bacterium]
MEYLSIKQTSEKWGISVRRIQILCSSDRIPGAQKVGYSWIIPANAQKPADARIKSGKYLKDKKNESNNII